MIIFISFVLWLGEKHVDSILVFQSTAIMEGQWWRIVTGHFLHTNLNHLIMNSAGIVLLWALHGEHYRPLSYTTIFLLCCLGTGFGLLFGSDITQYVGLSGALHGLFVWGAAMDIEKGYKSGWVLLAGVWLKVLYEQVMGASEVIVNLIASNVAVDAHFYGTMTGSVYLIHALLKKKVRFKTST